MKTIPEIAGALLDRLNRLGRGKMVLCDEAGVTPRTLRHVLSGTEDFKVSTLLAVADRLGLEVVLLPRDAAAAFQQAPGPQIKTRVQAALDRLKRGDHAG